MMEHQLPITSDLIDHEKRWAGRSTSWNQDCWEKYQQPQICRWHHPYSRADRGIGGVRHVAPPTWLVSNFLVRMLSKYPTSQSSSGLLQTQTGSCRLFNLNATNHNRGRFKEARPSSTYPRFSLGSWTVIQVSQLRKVFHPFCIFPSSRLKFCSVTQ